MPFVPMVGCTGFEPGSAEVVNISYASRLSMETVLIHSGVYSLELDGYSAAAYAKFIVDDTLAEIYLGAWIRPGSSDASRYFEFSVQVDGDFIGVRYDGQFWDAYVDGVKVADGAVAHTIDQYHLAELHIVIDNSGTIETKIDGIPDINYSGDTQPAASTDIDFVRVYQYPGSLGQHKRSYVDDFCMGTGDWPGDIRYAIALVPDADTAQKDWTPSTGSLNYDMVEDVPPNDAEYVSGGSVNDKDLYTLSDWTAGANEEPRFLVDWVRAKKDVADTVDIDLIVKSASTESSGSFVPSTSFAYYSRILDVDPDTSAEWTEGGINALQIGQEVL